jgi:tetratricopeptide (TPR) repeat protein
MNCSNCNHPYNENDNYCANCGHRLDTSTPINLDNLSGAFDWELKGKIKRAISEMKLVIEKNPTGENQMYYGQLLLYKGELHQAIQALELAIKENPLHPRSYFNLGLAWMRMGKIKKAIDYFKKTLTIDENFHLARYWKGLVYLHISDFENASRIFEVLIRKSPDYKIVHYHLGSIALTTGHYKEAIQHFDALETVADDDAQIFFYRGVAYYRQNEFVRARAEFEKTLALYPEHPKAQAYLEDIRYELETLM